MYGTFGSSGITAANAWTSYPTQTDMLQDNQVLIPWIPPAQMLPPTYSRVALNLDGSARHDGFLGGSFGPIKYITFGQIAYVLSTIFPSNADSSPVSMMVFDATDTAIFLNATMYRPITGQDYTPVFGGWQDLMLRYSLATIAP